MNREILFRGKRLDTGEWVEGDLCQGENACFIVYDNDFVTTSSCGDKELISSRFFEVNPDTVSQYTGLKDKNGNMIFEGDICRVVDNPLVSPDAYAIVWNDEFASWIWKDNRSEDCFYRAIANTSEVIGNRWDNPSLLEVSDND